MRYDYEVFRNYDFRTMRGEWIELDDKDVPDEVKDETSGLTGECRVGGKTYRYTAVLEPEESVPVLATITTKDEHGVHFTERYPDDVLYVLEESGLIAISRPVHPATRLEYGESEWTVEVTDAGLALVDACPEYHPDAVRDAVIKQAKDDAAAFVTEFGVILDPDTTDWDSVAWTEHCRRTLSEGAEKYWDLFQETLVLETERLVNEFPATLAPGLYATNDCVYAVMPSRRAWIVAAPDRDRIEEIPIKAIPANVIPADRLTAEDTAEYFESVSAESGESF